MSSIGNYSHCWPRFTVEHKKISCSNFVLKAQDWLPSPPANVPRFDLWSNKWLLLRDTPPAPPQLHKSYQIELIVTNYLILQPPRYYSLGTRAWIRACVKGTRHKQDGNLSWSLPELQIGFEDLDWIEELPPTLTSHPYHPGLKIWARVSSSERCQSVLCEPPEIHGFLSYCSWYSPPTTICGIKRDRNQLSASSLWLNLTNSSSTHSGMEEKTERCSQKLMGWDNGRLTTNKK